MAGDIGINELVRKAITTNEDLPESFSQMKKESRNICSSLERPN